MTHSNRALSASLARFGGVLLALVLIVAGMAWIGYMQDHAGDPQELAIPVSDSDWFQGGKDASVVLVEYSDFQCPACASYFPVMTALEQAYGDKLKIVYRNYPLTQLHPHAQLAAQAAEAAGLQGQFFAMHDLLFGNQKTWSAEADPTNTFIAYAEALKLDVARFTTDLTSDGVKDSIREDVLGRTRANVASTPTFFLNGFKIENPQGLDPFKAVIDAALNSTTPTTTTDTSVTVE